MMPNKNDLPPCDCAIRLPFSSLNVILVRCPLHQHGHKLQAALELVTMCKDVDFTRCRCEDDSLGKGKCVACVVKDALAASKKGTAA